MKNHPMIRALLALRGNPRACVYTEPLWGIPHSLYTPFVSVYMLALGLNGRQIGLVASLALLFRACTAAFGGAITDKLGRRRTTIIFDLISWSLPCLLWAFSQNIYWFIAAAFFNGFWQITDVSWTCLLVEDAEKEQMVNIYSWIHLAVQLSVFFAPLAGLLVKELSIIPAMRILYGFSFVSMTTKFVLLYRFSNETQVGKVRQQQTKSMSIFSIMAEYKELIPRFFHSRQMVLAMTITVLLTVTNTVMDNFFGVYTTRSLLLPEQHLAYLPIIRSAIMLLFIFFIQARITRFGFKGPMLVGIVLYVLGHLALVFLPGSSLTVILVYSLLVACAHGLVMPRKDSIVALFLEPHERARMSSLMTVVVLGVSIPFGYIAGLLSDKGHHLPFLLNILLFFTAFVVIFASQSLARKNTGVTAE